MKTVEFNDNDYIPKYFVNGQLDLCRLINDDFLLAVKLCYNNGYFISATKLLMCFIDSMSYVTCGESSGKSFQEYLNKFCDLVKIGITSEELWEHRNAILHVTGLDSIKISKGKVRRLISYVGTLTEDMPTGHENTKYFSLYDLMIEVGKSVENFVDSLIKNLNERKLFFERYDQVVSDVRKSIAMISE